MSDNRKRKSNGVVKECVFKNHTFHFVCKYCKEVYKSVPEFINHKITTHEDLLPKRLSRVPRPIPVEVPTQDPETKQVKNEMVLEETMEVESSSTGSSYSESDSTSSTGSSYSESDSASSTGSSNSESDSASSTGSSYYESDSDVYWDDDDDDMIPPGSDDEDAICTNTLQDSSPQGTISTREHPQESTSTQESHHDFTTCTKVIDQTEKIVTTEDQLVVTTSTKEDAQGQYGTNDEVEIPTTDDGGPLTSAHDSVPPWTNEAVKNTGDVELTFPEQDDIVFQPFATPGDEMVNIEVFRSGPDAVTKIK